MVVPDRKRRDPDRVPGFIVQRITETGQEPIGLTLGAPVAPTAKRALELFLRDFPEHEGVRLTLEPTTLPWEP